MRITVRRRCRNSFTETMGVRTLRNVFEDGGLSYDLAAKYARFGRSGEKKRAAKRSYHAFVAVGRIRRERLLLLLLLHTFPRSTKSDRCLTVHFDTRIHAKKHKPDDSAFSGFRDGGWVGYIEWASRSIVASRACAAYISYTRSL